MDFTLFPFHAKGVKGFGEITLRKIQRFCGVPVVGPFATVMQRTVDTGGFLPFEFHNINFAAGSPSAVFFIRGQHPDCGPQALSGWDLGAHLDLTVFPVTPMLGANAPGGIRSLRAVDLGVILMRFQNQAAIFDAHVFGAIRVDLLFVIAAAEGVFLNAPLGVIELGAVEFI